MKTIRIATCDWFEAEFSVPVVEAMPQRGKKCRFITDGEGVSNPFARKVVSSARAETNTVLLFPAA